VIGDLVKRRRQALRLTQTRLGALTGLQQDYISKLERGTIDMPQKGTLMALSMALGVTVADFYRAAGVLVEEDEQPQPARAVVSVAQPLMPMVFPVYDQPVSAGKGTPSVQEYMYLPPADRHGEMPPWEVGGVPTFPPMIRGPP